MAYYWKKCPYCGHVIESGGGNPLKHFGIPERTCTFCGKTYRDSDTIDYPKASLWKKFLFSSFFILRHILQNPQGSILTRDAFFVQCVKIN